MNNSNKIGNYLDKFKLNGKTAIISGGLGLIGTEITKALADAGANVIVIDINESKGNEIAKKYGVKFVNFDVTKLSDYDSEIGKLVKNFGKFDIWINAAYPRTTDWGAKTEDIKLESWQKNVDMQMNTYCMLTIKAAEAMKKNKINGSVINFGSTYGVVGANFNVYKGTEMTCPAAYAAIKGGIINFSKYCASYYGVCGIRVNCICPGGVFDNQNKTFVENYENLVPLRRMARADEIASAVLFLASDASSYITGATFMVDGGWTCI